MKVQSSENKLVITEEFIFDQNKLPSDPNNHFKYDIHNKVNQTFVLIALMLTSYSTRFQSYPAVFLSYWVEPKRSRGHNIVPPTESNNQPLSVNICVYLIFC